MKKFFLKKFSASFRARLSGKRTIEEILGYIPFSEEYLEQERRSGQFNGMGSDFIQLDELLKEIIKVTGKLYKYEKTEKLFNDFQQLFYRHDKEYVLKILKIYSDLRLSWGTWQLLHWMPWKIRLGFSFSIIAGLSTKEANKTYNY